MTQKSKHSNAGFTKWLEILAVEDFPPKLLWSENSDLKFRVSEQLRGRRQQETRVEQI